MNPGRRLGIQNARVCFVDTSAFYASLDIDDSHHETSVALFTELGQRRTRLLTSNYVLYETYSLVLNRLGSGMARRWLEKLNLHIERSTEGDERQALRIVRRYKDKGFSLVDAASFSLMERLGIRYAVAFDRHFRQYGRFIILAHPAANLVHPR